MTSRSRKKRPTTAPKQAKTELGVRWSFKSTRQSWLIAGLVLVSPATVSSPVSAQSPDRFGMRTVPKVRSAEVWQSSGSSNVNPAVARRPGWELQWRKSPTVDDTASQQISQQAYRADRTQEAANPPVQPAAFLNQFELPESVPAQPVQDLLPPPATTSPAIPSPTPDSVLSNPFRDGSLSDRSANESTPPAFDPSPPAFQTPTLPPTDDASIRDMLQDDSPATPPKLEDRETESPSDREFFDGNPFGRRRGPASDADPGGENRARNREMDEERRPGIFEEGEKPAGSGTGLSCEAFRQRIAADTIDKVSLDISPPFRPDVIDEAEYQELKTEFDEGQQVRTWRSIDGRPVGTGRLDDLAYEKAVIITEFGSREELPLNRLSEGDLAYISQNWGLPTECLIEQVAYTPRRWQPATVVWAASNLCHKPLYFEEVNLERYGHTAGPLAQPFISSAHFFLNIAVLPYKMGVHSPHECQYALGYYRPGNCAPWIIPPVPLSVKGAWYQAAAMSGTALLVP